MVPVHDRTNAVPKLERRLKGKLRNGRGAYMGKGAKGNSIGCGYAARGCA